MLLKKRQMKLIAGILAGIMVLMSVSVLAFAAEVTDEVSDESIEESAPIPPEILEQMPDDDKRFETDAERRARIAESADKYISENAVSENRPERHALTEDGYELVGSEGDAPDDVIIGGVTPSTEGKTGYITITADVPVNIHEEVFVYVMHMGNASEYGVYLYEMNGYSDTLCLPVGTYMVVEGGLVRDSAGKYFAVSRQFFVEPSAINHVEVTIHNIDDNANGTEVLRSDQQTVSEASINEVPETVKEVTTPGLGDPAEEEKKSWVKSLIGTLFSVVIIAGAIYALYRIFGSNKNNSRGFDE